MMAAIFSMSQATKLEIIKEVNELILKNEYENDVMTKDESEL